MSDRYSSSLSHRIALTPSKYAADPVVPLPENGSMIVPPFWQTRRISHCINATGFTVGCFDPARSCLLALAEYQNLDAAFEFELIQEIELTEPENFTSYRDWCGAD